MATAASARKVYERKTYLAQSLDPIHIGTGEFRLGRVDNTIVREAGTNLPKIPGSSIGGVCRAYSAMQLSAYLRPKGEASRSCAGKGGDFGEVHCGLPSCGVCTTYGFSNGKVKRSFQGLAQIGDARILLFPVYSVAGPVWVTCPGSLEDAGVRQPGMEECWAEWNGRLNLQQASVATAGDSLPNPLNLGWLYLPRYSGGSGSGLAPLSWTIADAECGKLQDNAYLRTALGRTVMVGDALFSHIVEDQLEVRTSVSINPETGAAEYKALFTAEAIPRACFFFFPVTYLNPANFLVPTATGGQPVLGRSGAAAGLDDVRGTVEEGLRLIEFMGIGGVNTRGMGRLRILNAGATR